jgi:protocatechuate 3,4-dioxygenase beta subunit
MKAHLSRRQALRSLLLGAAGASLAPTNTQAAGPAARQPAGVCVLFPQAVEGPYYFDPKLVRSDITDGRVGAPLRLALQVIESGACTPIANARVDVWHADAGGAYSGYSAPRGTRDTAAKRESYLRGTQMTDAEGRVTFRTIYPGWYPGRTPHIHAKVFLDKRTVLTGQLYFPDDVSARVYRERQPYAARPIADTTNATDALFGSGGRDGGSTVLAVEESSDLIIASLVIAVARSGRAAGWEPLWRAVLGSR